MIAARIPVAVVAGVLCTLAVFFGLWQLVGQPLEIIARPVGPLIDYTPKRVVKPIIIVDPVVLIHEPPRPRLTIPGVGLDTVDESAVRVRPDLFRTSVPRQIGGARGGMPMGVDRDVTPLVRVNPAYPPREERLGIEGSVRVQFDVTAVGAVRNAIVVASEPRGVFDEAALEAIARWRYNPRIVSGAAVERVGVETLFRFTIDDQP
jgi:protein TonB